MQQVVVFIDGQNTYRSARRAFFSDTGPHVYGQYYPDLLGALLTRKAPPDVERELKEVRVYSGRPDAYLQPLAYSAHMRQCETWQQRRVTVITRGLRYPFGWQPNSLERPQEKGIDVAIAVDIVTLAVEGYYDVGILVSADSDLKPAVEFVHALAPARRIEVAAWRSEAYRSRIDVRGVWNHHLSGSDYTAVYDPTDYHHRRSEHQAGRTARPFVCGSSSPSFGKTERADRDLTPAAQPLP